MKHEKRFFRLSSCAFVTAFVTLSSALFSLPSEAATQRSVVHANSKKRALSEGTASFYSKQFHGRKTANGETFNMNQLTAAHPSLPFGTWVKVTNLSNGKDVVVRINDRGPYVKGRIIDLSAGAANKLGILKTGITQVKVEPVKATTMKQVAG